MINSIESLEAEFDFSPPPPSNLFTYVDPTGAEWIYRPLAGTVQSKYQKAFENGNEAGRRISLCMIAEEAARLLRVPPAESWIELDEEALEEIPEDLLVDLGREVVDLR